MSIHAISRQHSLARRLSAIASAIVVAISLASLAISPAAAQDAQDEAASENAPAPVIEIDAPEYNAGEATPGTTIAHDFIVRNTGAAPLLISDVVPGCGCSVATFPSTVHPGDEGVITLSVDLYREWAGHDVNKMAVILSNDPASPATKITMRAKVLAQ